MEATAEHKNLLDQPILSLFKFDWERVILVAILLLAVLTRLWDLDYRSYNHDESIHTDWSWNLYTGRGYQHNPIYHGPFLYLVTAGTFVLFGDTDTTARLPNALIGIILVALPWLFRKWLGRKGALVTSALLLISPAVLYYSRFNRHDIYVELFVLLMALCIFKYFDDRAEKWLIASATFLALAYTAMETTFIFVTIFAVFLCAHFTFSFLRSRVRWSNFALGLFAAIFGIPFFGAFVGAHALAFWRTRDDSWRAIPSFDLAMIFGTFSLPLITPALFYGLNPIWQRFFQQDFLTISVFADANIITSILSQPDVVLRVLALTVGIILLSALLGIWWNARVWLVSAALFWTLFILFFTSVLTNGAGFFSGLLGSLGYWLSQQGVARGGQPSYYYLLVQLPLYEFLPYLVGIVSMFWYWFTHRSLRLLVILAWLLWIIGYYIALRPLLASAAPIIAEQLVIVFIAALIPLTFFATYDAENEASRFTAFLFTWVAGALIIFSWAGEKMPWLTIHLTIPLAFTAGWALEKLLNADWRDLIRRGAPWLAALIPLALVLFVAILTANPFQGVALAQLGATNAFVVAIVLLVAVVAPALYFIGKRFRAMEFLRISAVVAILLLAALTIRAAWLAVFMQPDVAVETLIYAQGSPDVPIAMREIEELSRRLCAQTQAGKTQIPCENGTIKVAYDDDSSWPFVWYLRNYRNAQFYGGNPNVPFDAPVVIAGQKNEEAIKPFLGNRYLRRQYKLIWWPLEGYKDLSLARVGKYFTDEEERKGLFDAWFYRKYKESLNNWPYVHPFSFYVRKDVASLLWSYGGAAPIQASDDEYAKKTIQLPAAKTMGTQGGGNSQFNFPRGVAFDAQGNMYVADSDNARVQKFDATGKFLLAFGAKSPDGISPAPPATFTQIWGIAVDRAGNVFVSDTWNHRIQKFDTNGKFIKTWGANGDTRGIAKVDPDKFYGPRALAVDAQGNLFVADTGNKRILKFSGNGDPLGQFGGIGSEAGFFQEPVGIALDANGNIFVADTWNLRVQKFDANFNFLAEWPVQAWDGQSVLNKPYLAADAEGNVFISDPEAHRIVKFSGDGKVQAVWGTIGVDLNSFNLPAGLAFDQQGNLWVADSGNHRVVMFSKP
ncbi:MAG: TIGR03663 family protein [Chloroflexi bacterium]|nr:TIGR03663 family protein [Chloroflexota bacterium]